MIRLNEIFWSAQGEGVNSGKPAIFIRLSGCSIHCEFCDQKDAWQGGELLKPSAIIKTVDELIRRYPASMVVITGGEPMEQDIFPLVDLLRKRSLFTAIETSGGLFQDLPLEWWTVAPKPNLDYGGVFPPGY